MTEPLVGCDPVEEPAPPVLVSLTVITPDTAVQDAEVVGLWRVPYDAAEDHLTIVQATTLPNDPETWAQIDWHGATVVEGSENRRIQLPRNALQDHEVEATLDETTRELTVRIVPRLDRLDDVAAAVATEARIFKFYVAAGGTATIRARTIPDTQAAWQQITWEGALGDSGAAHSKTVALDAGGSFPVKASLGGVEDELEVLVRPLPRIDVVRVQFRNAAAVVDNDTAAAFPAYAWDDAEPDRRIPACFVRNTAIRLSVVLEIGQHPLVQETFHVTGTADFGGTHVTWAFDKDIAPGDATPLVEHDVDADVAIPNVIAAYDALDVQWAYDAAGRGAVDGNVSRHQVYSLLGAPAGGVRAYWTLLDVSCHAADGDAAAVDLANHLTVRFADLAHPIQRKRDGRDLGYWTAPPGNDSGRNTQELLQNADGSGQCGAWALFFLDMLRVHGINTAVRVEVDHPNNVGFLVRNWNFSPQKASVSGTVKPFVDWFYSVPTSEASRFTHRIRGAGVPQDYECQTRPPNGAAGQNNPNPPPKFSNHFIVRYAGAVYDPSYGSVPFNDFRSWENASIQGLWCRRDPLYLAGYDNNRRTGMDPQMLRYQQNFPAGGVLSASGLPGPAGWRFSA